MLNAPRKPHPFQLPSVSPVSPTLCRTRSDPLFGGDCFDEDEVDSGLVIPTITAQLRSMLFQLKTRKDKLFHFCFYTDEKIQAVRLLELLRESWSLKKQGCYIARGCSWEKCIEEKQKNPDLRWVVTLKVGNPSDLMLSIICEYALSSGFEETNVYENPNKATSVIKCEYVA